MGVRVFIVYNVVFKGLLYFCLLHVVSLQVDSSRISSVSYEAYNDFSEELLHQWEPKARDASHISKRWRKMKRSLYERKFVQHLVGSEGKESKKVSYDRKVSSKKYSARLTGFRKEFLARPRKTGGHRHKQGTDRELISFRTLGEKDEFNSYAIIEPSDENHSGSKWTVTTVSSVFFLIIVLALCLHAPCPFLWKRQRSELDVISCPNPTVHNRPCGKCIFHSDANTGSRHFSSQFMWTQETHPPAKLNRTKKKVTALLKGTEPSAYRYTPLRNTAKREQQMTYEPEWTSIGAFLNNNNNRKTSFYNRSYGSTSESEKFVDRYGRRSRDSAEFTSELVEYALKLRPKRRQVIELKEFPPGYSKACLNIDLGSDPCVVYDPCLEQVHRIRRPGTSDRFTRSDSDFRKLFRADQSEKYDSTSLFNVAKPRKSSLKSLLGKSKSNSKVVHFFPSTLKYDKQFVQIPSQNEIIKTEEDNFQKKYGFSDPLAASKTTYIVSDMQVCLPSTENFSKGSEDKDLQEPPTKLQDTGQITKEHAIDWDLRSPLMETTSNEPFKQSRGHGSANVNLGFSHSTETVSGSKEMFTLSKDPFSSIRNMGTKQSLTKCYKSFSSSYTDLRTNSSCRDLHDIEADYKPEPLAGLLSPKLNASRADDVLTCRTPGYKTLPSTNKDKTFTDCIQQNSQPESVISRDQSSYRKYSNIPQDFSLNKSYPVKEVA